jgi:hypothetical protein
VNGSKNAPPARCWNDTKIDYRVSLFQLHLEDGMSTPEVRLAIPVSPTRARSVSQPIREGVASEFFVTTSVAPRLTMSRSQSSNAVPKASSPPSIVNRSAKGRARSSSLVTVTEVGGDEPETVVDRLGVGSNENAAWVNAPGKSRVTVLANIRRLAHSSCHDPLDQSSH